ncbi:hypothetical protein ACIOWI_29525 [Streptomyces sp. NPDC087659]|uniref:hypothetical protein n=1 Tax=Streptomyces sp. NPDC087659 TaxID=3365801 RepID=UPI00381C6374
MSPWLKHDRADHHQIAARARTAGGDWVEAGKYRSDYSAKAIAHMVRTGRRLPAYLPAGAYEPRIEQRGADTVLWVRYVARLGHPAPCPGTSCICPVRDGELVTAYRIPDGALWQHTGEFLPDGQPVYKTDGATIPMTVERLVLAYRHVVVATTVPYSDTGLDLLMDQDRQLWLEVRGADGTRYVDRVQLEAFGTPVTRDGAEAEHGRLRFLGRIS